METNQKVQNRIFSHLIFYSDSIFTEKKNHLDQEMES